MLALAASGLAGAGSPASADDEVTPDSHTPCTVNHERYDVLATPTTTSRKTVNVKVTSFGTIELRQGHKPGVGTIFWGRVNKRHDPNISIHWDARSPTGTVYSHCGQDRFGSSEHRWTYGWKPRHIHEYRVCITLTLRPDPCTTWFAWFGGD